MKLPFNLYHELQILRKLEKKALEADNAVLRQRLKIFPPLEAEVNQLWNASSLSSKTDEIIINAVKLHGSKTAAADALGIGRSTIYNRLRKLNGATKVLSILVLIMGLWIVALGEAVTIVWDASSDSTVTGYKLYHGIASRFYTNTMDVGTNLVGTLSNLTPHVTYHFAATAYNSSGIESIFSDELVYTVSRRSPPPIPNLKIQ